MMIKLYMGGKDLTFVYFKNGLVKKKMCTRLETSYRLPGKIYDFAIGIRDEINNRLGNEFTCHKRIHPEQ